MMSPSITDIEADSKPHASTLENLEPVSTEAERPRGATGRGHSRGTSQNLVVPAENLEDRQYVVGEPLDLDRICTRDTIRSHRSYRERSPCPPTAAATNIEKVPTKGHHDEKSAGPEGGKGENEKDLEAGVPLKTQPSAARSDGDVTSGSGSEDDEFLVDWDGPDDPNNPMNWSKGYRLFCLVTVALQTFVVVFYSSAYISGGPGMTRDFGVTSNTVIVLGLTTYLVGLALGPLLLAPLSEMYGRRIVYIISLGLFTILALPVCLAKNIATVIAIRFIAALLGSVSISNAPGTLADIFAPKYRSTAFSIFAIAPMNGPSLGPVFGGLLYEYLGWRSLNYAVLIAGALMWLLGFFVTETYAPHLLRQKAQRLRESTGDNRYHSRYDFTLSFWSLLWTNLTRPIQMLFTEAICAAWAIYIAVIYAILYMSFVSYPIVFHDLRGWAPKYSGLAFMGICAGTFLGIGLDPVVRWGYNKHKIDPVTGKIPPEALIWSVCVAAVLSPVGLWIFAWTSDPRLVKTWVVSILAGIPYGCGNTLIFIHGSNYLLNSYSIYAASALAGNTVARSILGGVLPLVAPNMYTALSPSTAGTILAVLATVLIPIPWIFYKWGRNIRERSPMLLALAKEDDRY